MAITVIPESHTDHNLTDEQKAHVLMAVGDKDGPVATLSLKSSCTTPSVATVKARAE